MDGPQPPRDSSLRNIIDKLAEFVARNGPEFEQITKQKQKGNPKFDFLYGGDYCNYYEWRVAAEQTFLKQQGSISQATHHYHPQGGPPPQQHNFHDNQSMSLAGQQQHNFHDNQNISLPGQQQHNFHDNQNMSLTGQQQHHNFHDNHNMPPVVNQQQMPGSGGGGNSYKPQGNPAPLWGNGHGGGGGNPANNANAISITAQIEAINLQQNNLRKQIHQSEQNLSAQHSALMQQQQKQIDDAIEDAQNNMLEEQAADNNISLIDFDDVLQPIIDACTKDSISAGKNWILQHSSDTAKNNVVLQYLLKKALLNGATFTQKLHLIYLVNDILHHCVRKNANDLKNSLENVVIPMFCSAKLIATNDQKGKLSKLLSLWESKAKFFDACVISKLGSPDSSMHEYKTNLMNMHHDIVHNFTQTTKSTLDGYQKQHQIFIQHATQQIAVLEQQKQALEQKIIAAVLPSAAIIQQLIDPKQLQTSAGNLMQNNDLITSSSIRNPSPQPLMAQKVQMPTEPPNVYNNSPNPGPENNNQPLFGNPFSNQPVHKNPFSQFNNLSNNNGGGGICNNPPTSVGQAPIQHHNPFSSMGSSNSTGNDSNDFVATIASFFIPDLSKPPPGFMNPSGPQPQLPLEVSPNVEPLQVIEEDPKPTAPYYDLPAGLMVSLIRLEDYSYKPIDPEEMRLPAPTPQSERLTNALAAFIAPPSHDRPRDNEGWEKLGLYEYYKVKNAAKKQKEEELKDGTREPSRSPSPIILDTVKTKKPINKRCYRSKSRSRSPRSKSRSPRRSRSRSRSPSIQEKPRGRYSNNSRNRSPRKNSPIKDRDRERDRDRDRDSRENREREMRDRDKDTRERDSRDRNNTRRERERSITPPSFFGGNYNKSNEFIEESNKGHQMLMKMGWAGSGAGLGTKNQGIDEPISGGEVRERRDMYKGVGSNMNDPFENFRKNKGAAFVHRMRTRDDKS
ncbi:calcium homeostasis endoplasmic reticulum protein isoform X2 [Episyrphus balteatus]|uniref:calcium homeostasis endoplasmic reticulum protein isoform X2 n=1 Tax=Episyrphus balteatus TaxID=286459 RepID=UPI0024864708|nr:calcium homeostasis endoplasmic reticulum protein isoform X2 [Episyrphus balteatus]